MEFTLQADSDSDLLHFVLEFARDASFIDTLTTLDSSADQTGWIYNDVAFLITGVQGYLIVKYGAQSDFTEALCYWRVKSFDSMLYNSYSMVIIVRKIATGDVVSADITIYVCNNTNDISPVWEEVVFEELNVFANSTNIAADGDESVKVTINANDSVGDIHVDVIVISYT